MNRIAPPHEPLIREVPLSRLALAPENVRKTPADPVAEAEMKASIAAHGLLENLVVRIDGPADAGTWAVVAGGRRLAAMKALAEDGTIDPDHPVPCLVAADPDMAGELSLAENVVRIAMHPADQVIAFTKLADSGLTVAEIAARFGTTERPGRTAPPPRQRGAGPARRLSHGRNRPGSAEGLLRHARSTPARWRPGSRSRARATGPPPGR